MKIKRYGKNQRALKKLLADEETEVLRNGVDFKSLLQTLIGFEFKFEKIKDGLKLTDLVAILGQSKHHKRLKLFRR